MRKAILFATLICCSQNLLAQYHYRQQIEIGLEGGVPFNLINPSSFGGKPNSYDLSAGGGLFVEVPLDRTLGLKAGLNYLSFNYKERPYYRATYSDRLHVELWDWYAQIGYRATRFRPYLGIKFDKWRSARRDTWEGGVKISEYYPPSTAQWDCLVKLGVSYYCKWGFSLFMDYSIKISKPNEDLGNDTDLSHDGFKFGFQYRLCNIPFRKFYHSRYEN